MFISIVIAVAYSIDNGKTKRSDSKRAPLSQIYEPSQKQVRNRSKRQPITTQVRHANTRGEHKSILLEDKQMKENVPFLPV